MRDWDRQEDGCIVNDSFCGSFEYCDECKREIRHRRRIERKRMENEAQSDAYAAMASCIVAIGYGMWHGVGHIKKAIQTRRLARKPVIVIIREES